MKRIVLAAWLVIGSVAAGAQQEWVHVGQDPGHTKYSTLDQINVDNVQTLQRAWTFHTGDKTGFFESTPLVVSDVMYVSAQNGVFALDPATGAQRWKFETLGNTRRGLAYWPGDARVSPRLFVGSGTRLLAIDTKTGKLALEFGEGGFVEMGSAMHSPPSIYKDVLIAPQTSPVIRAWNARTGAALWTFHLVAQPGDPNHKTWENDAWKTIGGTNTWGFLSADIERGIVYIPVSIAGSDYVGVERPGDNLYGTSLVAADIATGQRKWHQQFVHHDIWDFDLAAAPTLFDAVKDGKTIPGVAEVTKMGMLFMFDRVTGEPLFGMEERPVPQSSVPGEKTSPTQPFPLKPPPLARISLKKTELPSSISPERSFAVPQSDARRRPLLGAGPSLSVQRAAVGRVDCGKRQHRRHRMARAARHFRRARQERDQDRHGESRRRDDDRGEPRVHRRDDRRLLQGLRCAQREGTVGNEARRDGSLNPVDLHGQRRQAVRRHRCRRRRFPAKPAVGRSDRVPSPVERTAW